MSFKVVLNSAGQPVAFGPNEPGYVPGIPAGGSLVVQESAPTLAPPVVPPSEQIDALERQYMLPRPVRDVLLPLMEAKAAELGYTPAQLRIANPGYRRVKELDEQIAALRALL